MIKSDYKVEAVKYVDLVIDTRDRAYSGDRELQPVTVRYKDMHYVINGLPQDVAELRLRVPER